MNLLFLKVHTEINALFLFRLFYSSSLNSRDCLHLLTFCNSTRDILLQIVLRIHMNYLFLENFLLMK